MKGKEKATLGIEENIAGALSYLLGFITGILFLLLEKENQFVRFHAVQSIIYSIGIWVLMIVVRAIFFPIPYIGFFIGGALSSLVGLLGFLLWLFLMYKAYEGMKYKLPVIGDHAERYAKELEI